MKYVVKVADKHYEVEIEDLYARPVIARVDGQAFEVNPEDGDKVAFLEEVKESQPIPVAKQPSNSSSSATELTAPLPGTVIELFVKVGEHIEAGQVMLIIEAMKMKNSIRSTRAGTINEILVSAGQTVAHKQPLVRFE